MTEDETCWRQWADAALRHLPKDEVIRMLGAEVAEYRAAEDRTRWHERFRLFPAKSSAAGYVRSNKGLVHAWDCPTVRAALAAAATLAQDNDELRFGGPSLPKILTREEARSVIEKSGAAHVRCATCCPNP